MDTITLSIVIYTSPTAPSPCRNEAVFTCVDTYTLRAANLKKPQLTK